MPAAGSLDSISPAVAVLAGLVSFVSPCVLPLVPAYVAYLGSRAGRVGSMSVATAGLAFVAHSEARPGPLDMLARLPGEVAGVPGRLAAGDAAHPAVAIAAGLAVLGFAVLALRGADARVRLIAPLAAIGPAVLVAFELKRGSPLGLSEGSAAL